MGSNCLLPSDKSHGCWRRAYRSRLFAIRPCRAVGLRAGFWRSSLRLEPRRFAKPQRARGLRPETSNRCGRHIFVGFVVAVGPLKVSVILFGPFSCALVDLGMAPKRLFAVFALQFLNQLLPAVRFVVGGFCGKHFCVFVVLQLKAKRGSKILK